MELCLVLPVARQECKAVFMPVLDIRELVLVYFVLYFRVMTVKSLSTTMSSQFRGSEEAVGQTSFRTRCVSVLFLPTKPRTFTLYVPEGQITSETDIAVNTKRF